MERESQFVQTKTRECLTETFVKAIAYRYHYEWKDHKKMCQVAADLRSALKGQEGFYCILSETFDFALKDKNQKEECYAGVIVTLGAETDSLQEIYTKRGDLEGAYMIEIMSGELLRNAYKQFSDWLYDNACYEAVSFLFFGAEEELPMEKMKELLDCQEEERVKCNEAYCLEPKKSVVFLAKLKKKEKGKENRKEKNISAVLCAGCKNKECIYKIS